MKSMEIWVKSVGPMTEERHLATIDGPGLWEITGENTGGKSTLARAMLLFGDQLGQDTVHVSLVGDRLGVRVVGHEEEAA